MNSVLGLEGDLRIEPDDLEDIKTRAIYSSSGEVREQERDTAKLWKKGNVIFCLFGLENQTSIDKYMPVRIIGYEGGDYRIQITKRNDALKLAKMSNNKDEIKRLRELKFYPVITLVLYYGLRHWKKPKNLFECLEVPEYLKPFVNDYKIHVVEVAWLTEEQENKFTSDFKFVVNYFRQNQTYEKLFPKEGTNMRDILGELFNKHKAEGIAEGRMLERKSIFSRLIELEGLSREKAANILGLSLSEVADI